MTETAPDPRPIARPSLMTEIARIRVPVFFLDLIFLLRTSMLSLKAPFTNIQRRSSATAIGLGNTKVAITSITMLPTYFGPFPFCMAVLHGMSESTDFLRGITFIVMFFAAHTTLRLRRGHDGLWKNDSQSS